MDSPHKGSNNAESFSGCRHVSLRSGPGWAVEFCKICNYHSTWFRKQMRGLNSCILSMHDMGFDVDIHNRIIVCYVSSRDNRWNVWMGITGWLSCKSSLYRCHCLWQETPAVNFTLVALCRRHSQLEFGRCFHMHCHCHEWKVCYFHSLEFIPKGPFDDKSVLVQIMTWGQKHATWLVINDKHFQKIFVNEDFWIANKICHLAHWSLGDVAVIPNVSCMLRIEFLITSSGRNYSASRVFTQTFN